jgi:hypothetical protein
MLAYPLPVDPSAAHVPEELSYYAKLRVIKTQVEAQTGREMTDDDLSDWLTENAANQEELSKLDEQVLQYTAQMEDAWGKGVELEAAQVAQKGTWGYHPAGPKNVEEFLRNALQGTSHGAGNFKRLKTLVDLVVPFCVKKGISIPDAAWQEGSRSKFEFIAERVPELRAATAAGQEVAESVERRITDMLELAADQDVTLTKLKDTYPPTQRRIEPADAWDFQEGGNHSFLVIEISNPAQANRIKGLLSHVVNFHLGTGTEPFWAKLQLGGSQAHG